MRVMLTEQAYDPATGSLLPGETEDYLISGGQVFQPDDSAQTSGLAQPLAGPDPFGQFFCKGSVVPHGSNSVFFDIEQTIASRDSDFQVHRMTPSLSQPTTEDGERATGVSLGGTRSRETELDKEADSDKFGRRQLRIEATIFTTRDAPDRLEGPFIIDVSVSGQLRGGKNFRFSQECAFYVDHSDAAVLQVPGVDGFRGGPGRAALIGRDDPKFIILQHGRGLSLVTDAMITRDENRGSRNDKTSLTVFGDDGKVIDAADLEAKAGIKSITPASSGRGFKIKTVKDDHDPPVQRIVIRLKGTAPDGTTFWDYYRVVIVHERGTKAKKLVTDFMESGVAYNFTEEGEAQEVAYIGDGGALLLLEAPSGDILFDDVTTICVAGGGQHVRHPFHSSFGGVSSRGVILDYPGGQSSDVFYIPPSNPLSRNVSGGSFCPPLSAVNVTSFGSNSGFFILEATGCFDKIVFSELNIESGTFRLGAVQLDGSWLAPVPGGEDYRDPSCFTYDGLTGIVGSTTGAMGRSEGGYVPIDSCNATCTESVPASKVILPADAPNVHMLGLAVSPDAMKIAWYRSAPDGSQVWVGDFDPFTQTVSNHQQLTTEGFNFDPTWSPDGSQIAFLSDRDGNLEIYVMFADGSDQTNITNTPDADEVEPSWQVP